MEKQGPDKIEIKIEIEIKIKGDGQECPSHTHPRLSMGQ
jgi:hypothetical protein